MSVVDQVMISQNDTPAVMLCCGSICRAICCNLSDMMVRRASREGSTGKGRYGMRTNFEAQSVKEAPSHVIDLIYVGLGLHCQEVGKTDREPLEPYGVS